MGTNTPLKLERIIEISNGIEIIGGNSFIDGTTSYRLGRLADHCKSPVKVFNKQREERRLEVKKEQDAIRAKMKTANEVDAAIFQTQIDELDKKYSDMVDALLEEEEEIAIPELKLSSFIASDDIKDTRAVGKGEDQKNVEITIKKGRTLVPTKFFALMGDIIKE